MPLNKETKPNRIASVDHAKRWNGLSHNKKMKQSSKKKVQDYEWLGGKGNSLRIVQKINI